MDIIKNMKEISNLIEIIEEIPQVIAIIIFGSYAKGNHKSISDIDIAVILENPSIELEAEVGSLYSSKIDLVLFHKLPLYIKYEVFKYGEKLFCKDYNKLLEIEREVLRKYLEMSSMYERIKQRVLLCK